MYGKRNRQRLEARIQQRRQEFRERGLSVLDEQALRRPRQSSGAGPSSSSRSTTTGRGSARRRSTSAAGGAVDGVDGMGDDYSEDLDDDEDEGASTTSGKGKGRSRRGSTRSFIVSPRQASTIEAAGSGGVKRRARLSSEFQTQNGDGIYGGYDGGNGSMAYHQQQSLKAVFSIDDRVALVGLLTSCGPNPSPADLLRFGAKVSHLPFPPI